jgi:hypothetical protein
VYGSNLDLRSWLEEHQYCYVGAVANTEAVGIQTATGRKRLIVAEAASHQHFLLIRRRLDDPTEKTIYLVFAPPATTLANMVQAIGTRWSIETGFETSKAMGMAHYEVWGFTAWYRFITLVMVVLAALAGICAATRASPVERAYPPAMSAPLPLTIPEVRHLLATLLWPLPRSTILILHWSWWRR